MVHFWKGVVFSVLLMLSALAVLFQVPCYYQTPEETLAMKERAENPSWLLWVSSFITYCPCLSVTFACPMLQPPKKAQLPSKGAKLLITQFPALLQGLTRLNRPAHRLRRSSFLILIPKQIIPSKRGLIIRNYPLPSKLFPYESLP